MPKNPLGTIQPRYTDRQSTVELHFVAASSEFVGTFMFLFLAFCGHTMAVNSAASTGPNVTNSNSTVVYISLSYGFSLLVTAWTMYRVSGGLFNPAVTLGLVLTDKVPPIRGVILLLPQLLGGICAAAVVSAIIPGSIATVQTTLGADTSPAQGVFLEMFLTAILVYTVIMLAGEKSKDTFLAPIGIGLALFIAEIAGVYYTGASLNPARSFGPCVAAGRFQGYHWIYWVGPFLGALISAGYFAFVKYFNYEQANPGQDSAGGDFGGEVEEDYKNKTMYS
ncbi:aquaporin-like protein [Polychaeton citri CBS 116435]|uniref:Aquaporin-like protein n=1 Tax=Polychaeton citri CBS 116435 TaxID=1314669 RepID=A0A9P4Q2H0_9PEZI|nr:aquaporin-like protein [Polychaeton citri CBS 116435]